MMALVVVVVAAAVDMVAAMVVEVEVAGLVAMEGATEAAVVMVEVDMVAAVVAMVVAAVAMVVVDMMEDAAVVEEVVAMETPAPGTSHMDATKRRCLHPAVSGLLLPSVTVNRKHSRQRLANVLYMLCCATNRKLLQVL